MTDSLDPDQLASVCKGRTYTDSAGQRLINCPTRLNLCKSKIFQFKKCINSLYRVIDKRRAKVDTQVTKYLGNIFFFYFLFFFINPVNFDIQYALKVETVV